MRSASGWWRRTAGRATSSELPRARALYASHWRAIERAFRHHLPAGCRWTEPEGGFLTWVTLPEAIDAVAMRPAAAAAGVAYVPGPPFYSGEEGRNELRLSFSHLTEPELDAAVERLAGVIRASGPSG